MHSTKAWKIRLRGTRSLLSDRIGPIRSVFLSGKSGELDRATHHASVRGLDGPFWPSGFPIGEYHVVICCTSQLTVTSSSGYRCIESTLFNSFILQEIQTIFKRLEHEFYRPFRQDCHADLDYMPLHVGGISRHSIPKSRQGSVVGVSVTLAVWSTRCGHAGECILFSPRKGEAVLDDLSGFVAVLEYTAGGVPEGEARDEGPFGNSFGSPVGIEVSQLCPVQSLNVEFCVDPIFQVAFDDDFDR